MSNFIFYLQFLGVVYILTAIGWPLSRLLFRNWPDQGFIFARTIGTLLAAWLLWITSSFKIFSITPWSSWGVVALVGVTSWLLAYWKKSLPQWRAVRMWIGIDALIYIPMTALWTFLRTYNPDIIGLEKFMDFGFMQSILKGQTMPPLNHFLGGETINYYYYGHYLAAFMKNLTLLPAGVTYHLQMSHILGLGLTHSFIIGVMLFTLLFKNKPNPSLKTTLMAGTLSAIFVNLIGNSQAIFYQFTSHKGYFYPNATRFIPFTIHEFPLYSYLVNDLHGHVSDIPGALLALALIITTYLALANQQKPFQSPLIWILGVFCLVVGGCYVTNAWDFPIYLLLMGVAVWTAFALQLEGKGTRLYGYFSVSTLVRTAQVSFVILTLSILFFLPFWIDFHSISRGIGLVPSEKSSPFFQLIILWILPLIPIQALLCELKRPRNQIPRTSRYLFICIFIVGCILIAFPEFFYMKDIYPSHFRSNTMFKFYYQAWLWFGILAGVGTTYCLVSFFAQGKLKGALVCVVSAAVLGAGFTYTYFGVKQQFNLSRTTEKKSLEGTDFLKTQYEDWDAIVWLNEHVMGQPIIAEGVGDSYTKYARISTFTGLPSVMGWPVHIWLWNGSLGDPLVPQSHVEKESGQPDTANKRIEDIKKLYETEDANIAKQITDRYHISYIIVGELERKKYLKLHEAKFLNISDLVHENKSNPNMTRIFKVRN